MIYEKHNFRQNLQNAIRFSDKDAAIDVVINEISKKYSNNKKEIINVIKNSGIKIDNNPSDRKVATIVVDNIGNEPFIKNIFASIKGKGYSNVDGDTQSGNSNSFDVKHLVDIKRSAEQKKTDIDSFVTKLNTSAGKETGKNPLLTITLVVGSIWLVTHFLTKQN